MTCPICQQPAKDLRSAVRNGQYISKRCDNCHANSIHYADKARAFERDWQRREYAKDLVQPWEPEFIKAYPDKARNYGWDDNDFRKYG